MFDQDEVFNILQQQASQQISGTKAAYVGYIVEWRPDNTILVANTLAGTIPTAEQQTIIDGTPLGKAMIDGPMALSTLYAGLANGVNPINPSVKPGIVIAPLGGATETQPTLGEQVLVININNKEGYRAAAFLLFNTGAKPPSLSIPVSNVPLKPGEWLAVNPSGTTLHCQIDGTLNLYAINPPGKTGGKINLVTDGNIDAYTAGKFTLNADGNITLDSATGSAEIDALTQAVIRAQGPVSVQSTNNNVNLTAANDVNLMASKIARITSQLNMFLESVTGNIALSSDTQDVTINAGRDIIEFGGRNTTLGAQEQFLIQSQTANISLVALVNVFINAINGFIQMNAREQITLQSTQSSIGITAGNNPAGVNQDINLLAPRGSVNITSANNKPINVTSAQQTIVNSNSKITMQTSGAPSPGGGGQNISIKSIDSLVMQSGAVDYVATTGAGEIDIISKADMLIAAGYQQEADIGTLRIATNEDMLINVGDSIIDKHGQFQLTAHNGVEIAGYTGFQLTHGFGGVIVGGVSMTDGNGGTLTLKSEKADVMYTGDILLDAQNNIDHIAGNDITSTTTRDILYNAGRDEKFDAARDVVLSAGRTAGIAAATSLGLIAPNIAAGDGINTVLSVLTTAFFTAFNSHQHTGVQTGGGNTGGVLSPITAGPTNSTTVFKAN